MKRGFDDLMTPLGLNLVVFALFLFVLVVFAGGIFWRLLEQENRRKRQKEQSEALKGEPSETDSVIH